ncbi:MAG TPA: SAVED domain-containing protein, partial [Candidatus Cloacimonas sp.]|nr:SAVED domain-containing protein [Candidatus Cloacimonas sp.]
ETSQNWLPYVQEINSALNAAREKNHWQRIHLFQTAPIALCMALGIAIGHFVPIDVYHYQFNASEPKYRCMFSMDKILSL